jgi:hypothetical protein
MLLEHLKNSLNTWGKPTKYPRTYNLREDGRHEVFWVGSTGVKAQAIYSEYNPDGTTVTCFICGIECLTSCAKHQRKEGKHKRNTCTRKCQDKLTQCYEWNPRMIARDDEGWYKETKGPQKGYIVKRVRKLRLGGKYKGRMHRVKIYQHRSIMEEHLGRKLTPNEQVHHVDMNKSNNDISNLWLCSPSDHMSAHHSFNQCCEELMGNFHKYNDIRFNIETGRYYLINNEKETHNA